MSSTRNINDLPSAGQADRLQWRLARLAAADSLAADRIRSALLSSAEYEDGSPARLEAAEVARQWLASEGAHDVIIVPGAGAGLEVAALLDLLPEQSKVFLIERDPARAARLFSLSPIEILVEQGRMKLAIGEDCDYAESQFTSLLDLPKAPTLRVFGFGEGTALDRTFYSELLLQIRRRVRTKVFNLGTLVQHGCLWQHNTLKNLSTLLANPGVNALEGLFPGRPALVVAAGPSLNGVLEILRETAQGFVILATGTALRPLRKAGIRPDLVVAVDASPKVAEQFETECADLYLACSSMVCPEILGKMRGLFSGHVNANPVGVWVSSLGVEKGHILGAGTVSATAMDLAVRMGCNPVVTVGLDLCMAGDGTSHAQHTMYHGAKVPEGCLYQVPGNYRPAVPTTNQFRVYIDAIGNYVQGLPATRFINVNSGGAAILGMELAAPEQLAGFAGAPFEAGVTLGRRHESYEPAESDGVVLEMKRIAEQLGDITREAVNAAMLCNRLIMHLRSRSGNRELAEAELAELGAIDARITAAGESSLLIDMSLRAIYYAAGTKEEEQAGEDLSGVQANRRSRDLYEQIAGAAKLTRAHLQKVAGELEAVASGGTMKAQQVGRGQQDIADKQAA